MAAFRNPMQLEPEPYENQFESQVRLSSTNPSSSLDALNAFYADMERKQSAERKLSKGKSIWSRKSVKKPVDPAPSQNGFVQKVPSALHALPAPENDPSQTSLPPDDPPASSSQSIIPDVSIENPQWEAKELEWATVSAIAFRAKHPIHNSMGPRYYKNHHIIPPHAKRENRPPSVFSPSFPPMAPSLHTHSQDSSWTPGPSRSPSGSPLPTPNSSQTRINDPSSKSRSRKTSQTAHDNVDLLDVTDPWGQAWHHESPYDVGLTRTSVEDHESPTSPVSPVTPNNHTRSRRSSVTAPSRHKTVAPSPLSQSTSAVHLRSFQTESTQVTRRMSKHRKPFRGLFGSHDLSTTVSSGDLLQPVQSSDAKLGRKLSKRSSTSAVTRPTFMSNQQFVSSSATMQGDKKEKRESILGRLARKFSIARKPDSDKRASQYVHEGWHHVTHPESEVNGVPDAQGRPSSPEKLRNSRRVPAPVMEPEPSSGALPSPSAPDSGERSSASLDLETPITLGRLTIANPDDPSSTTTTPAFGDVSLPPIVYPSPPHDFRVKESSNLRSDDAPPPVPSKSTTPFHSTIPLESAPSHKPPPEVETHSPPEPLPFATSPEPIKTTRSEPFLEPTPSPYSVPADLAPSYVAFSQEVDDSPLSRASLFVNPPTPHAPSNGITEPSRSDHEPNPVSENNDGPKIRTTSSGKVRQTETFKLVRSPSENIYANSQTIMADGEQWEVIDASSSAPKRSTSGTANSPVTKERSKSHSRDDESIHSKREPRRHEKEKSKRESYYPDGSERHRSRDDESVHNRESRKYEREKSKRESWYRRDSTEKHTSKDNDSGHSKRESKRSEKSKRESISRQDNGDRHRPSIGQPTSSSSSSSVPTRTSIMEPSRRTDRTRSSKNNSRRSLDDTGSSSKPFRQVEPSRRPSMSARPTSEVPSIAELNNVRAREAWEMDRLWKGRSMSIGQEGSNVISSPQSTGNELDHHMLDDLQRSNTVHSNGHGSSRTYFVVQTPFQAPTSVVTVSPPPPILYTHQSPSSLAFPTVTTSPTNSRNTNPPPEPIRATPYQLAPLPPSLASLDDPASREYWAKLAGVPAHH